MKKKSVIFSIIFAILLIAIAFLTYKIIQIKNDENNKNINNNINNNISNILSEKELKNIANNLIKQKINNLNSNTNENTNNVVDEEATEENVIQSNINNKEKAIQIAQKDWGIDDSVYFYFEQIDDKGKYVIAVIKKSDSKVWIRYYIDIENETYTTK